MGQGVSHPICQNMRQYRAIVISRQSLCASNASKTRTRLSISSGPVHPQTQRVFLSCQVAGPHRENHKQNIPAEDRRREETRSLMTEASPYRVCKHGLEARS